MATEANQNLNQSDGTVNPPETSTPKLDEKENFVPGYRVKEEADKRRAAEAKVADLEKKEQERLDKDKGWETKFNEMKTKHDDLVKRHERDKVESVFVSQAKEAGLPEKIAKLAIPKDLKDDEDSIKDAVKSAIKEFKDFVKIEGKKEDPKPPTNPVASIQPGSAITSEPKSYQERIAASIAKDNTKNKI